MTDLVTATIDLDSLIEQVKACRHCESQLPFGPRPVIHMAKSAKLMIIGQAPGRRVHETGIPWNDPSGDRLRDWMGLDRDQFYNTQNIAIMPMGFCYPGKGKSGDLPPRKECAGLWHQKIWHLLPNIELTLVIGQYAQHHYLGDRTLSLTSRVKQWRNYLPKFLPLPHPSPRNELWLKKNRWFTQEVLPELKLQIKSLHAKTVGPQR